MTMSSWQENNRSKGIKIRMALVVSLFLFGLCAVIGRVYYLQAIAQEDLEAKQTVVDRSMEFKPRRGSILDRNGKELAISVKAPSIYVHPRQIEDRDAAATKLAEILQKDRETVYKKLDPKRTYAWLARQIPPDVANQIMELKLKGVGLAQEHKRYYPQQGLAGQILGFVGIDNNGLEGIESAYESKLAGDKTKIMGKRDAQGRMMLTNEAPKIEAFEGASIELTIDERIQRVAETELNKQIEKYNAKGGYAVVIHARTGEVLALANTPSFDPNRFREFTSSDWRLRTITDTFEPGSVVKPLVLAAALQENTVNLQTRFDCENGRIKIGRYSIRDSHAHETLTSAEIVQVSSNICAYKMAQTIGREKLYQYYKNFGFGARTGLGVRGEQPGLVWPAERWAEVSFANVAFGQGFTATPLQVANATAAIANGGMLMKPRLVRRILDRDGNVVEQPRPELVRQVVSPQVAEQTARAMALVTVEGGTAIQAAMDDFTVAGKTGTAQKVNPKTRRYDHRMWVASFVGFLPAENPEIVIAVSVDEPQRVHYGGVVSAPVFKKIAEEAVHVLGILPVPESERWDVAPKPENTDGTAQPAEKVAARKEVEPQDEQVFDLGASTLSDVSGNVETNIRVDGGIRMPNLRGLTVRQAIEQGRRLGALPEINGWGRVVSQSPEAGEIWKEGDPIKLELLPATDTMLIAEEPALGSGE